MNREDSALEIAAKRLDLALGLIEQRMAQSGSSNQSDEEVPRLRAELDQSRSREKALEAAGSEASKALGHAIAEIRATLARGG